MEAGWAIRKCPVLSHDIASAGSCQNTGVQMSCLPLPASIDVEPRLQGRPHQEKTRCLVLGPPLTPHRRERYSFSIATQEITPQT